MLEIASLIIIYLILAALLGWIIGYSMGKATCSDKNNCSQSVENTHELHVDNKEITPTTPLVSNPVIDRGTPPLLLTEAREGGKDNLQLIKGVGKVLERILNESGIYHFDQIANLSTEEVKWLDTSISFPGRVKRENWIAQAKELSEGKATEFSQRVEHGEVASSKKSD